MTARHFTSNAAIPILLAGFIAVILLLPDHAFAFESVYDQIRKPTSDIVKSWGYFRSFINYVIVGGLILVAFANVLRLNVDTYAVKKILPTLFIAFLLANFSLLLAQVLLAIAESLTQTMHQFAIARAGTGSGGIDINGATGAVQALTAAIGQALFPGSWEGIGANVGAIATGGGLGLSVAATLGLGGGVILPAAIGAIVIYALLFTAPSILAVGIWIILSVRFYLLQVLIAVAPVAFMMMAFPFSRSLFQKWMSLLMTWTFMQPVMYGILAIGAIAITF